MIKAVLVVCAMLGAVYAQVPNLDIDLNCNTYVATDAVLDTSVSTSTSGGSAVTIHDGSLTGNIREFQFLISGRFELNSTNALLTGHLVPTGATTLDHGYYFLLSMALAPDAQGRNTLQAGVSVDLSSWMYFSIQYPSYLIGFGDFASQPIPISQLLASLPFQVGIGANGKNLHLGASVSIDITVGTYHVTGDVNIDLTCDLSAHSSSSSSNELPSSSSSSSIESSSSSVSSEGGVVCTQEVRDCPDGSSVGRNPNNNCEYYDCPSSSSSSSSSSSPSSSSSSEGSNGCSVSVSVNAANRWIENGRTTTLIYVTMTNNGNRAIKDVALVLDNHGDSCSAFASSCIRQFWSMSTSACASTADAYSCTFGLPDWLTLYGGLRVGAEHNWGFITYSPVTDIHLTTTCYDA